MVISVLHMKEPVSREIILPNITQQVSSQAEATTYSWKLIFHEVTALSRILVITYYKEQVAPLVVLGSSLQIQAGLC